MSYCLHKVLKFSKSFPTQIVFLEIYGDGHFEISRKSLSTVFSGLMMQYRHDQERTNDQLTIRGFKESLDYFNEMGV